MKLEVGKYYKTRDGLKVGPMMIRYNVIDGDGPFTTCGWNYDEDGTCSNLGGNHKNDLISEWVDDQPQQQDYAYQAEQHGILIIVTNGDITITYDGRDQ